MSRTTIARHRTQAKARLEPHVFGYVAATADGSTEVETERWDAVRFRPLALRGLPEPRTETTVLGTTLRHPVMIAPMAQQVAAHPAGETETALAAIRSGTLLGVSMNTAVPFADIGATGAPWWYQTYLLAEEDLTFALAERATAAGARAILLTVELVRLAGDGSIEPANWPAGPGRARLSNLTPDERDRLGNRHTIVPGLDMIERLRAVTGLPIIAKGVLRGDDARRVVNAGADGVLVSTHGNRRIAGSIASVDALSEVVDAVGSEVEVYVDSGIRDGHHVLAAQALGARAVFVGRPAWWALATGGGEAVSTVIDEIADEYARALRQSGVSTGAEAFQYNVAVPPR